VERLCPASCSRRWRASLVVIPTYKVPFLSLFRT
jgi:hypothetical protein